MKFGKLGNGLLKKQTQLRRKSEIIYVYTYTARQSKF